MLKEELFIWGKERSEKWVYEKLLRKGFYEVNIQTNFDYDNHVKKLINTVKK